MGLKTIEIGLGGRNRLDFGTASDRYPSLVWRPDFGLDFMESHLGDDRRPRRRMP
jgi:hypothetical protein